MAIIDVVKYNGKPDVLAWKYPSEELGTWTQVIVNESQQVVFVKEGRVLDILGPGRHVLDTANIPILHNIINLPFGGDSPFTAEIWYINKINVLDVKWGTAPAMQLQDPKYNIFIPVMAYGQFGIQIKDSKAFFTKLIGTISHIDQKTLVYYFRGLLMSNAKTIISSYLVKKRISILELNAYMSEISETLEEELRPELEEYGISLLNFYVTNIETPENDPAVKKLKEALAKRAEMDIVGYDYTTARSFDTLESAAKNEGAGSTLMNAGIGLGMGLGVGKQFGDQMQDLSGNLQVKKDKKEKKEKCNACGCEVSKDTKFCPNCGEKIGLFCSNCGGKIEKHQKFCPNCGHKQIKECPTCHFELKAGFKFCPNCGEKL